MKRTNSGDAVRNKYRTSLVGGVVLLLLVAVFVGLAYLPRETQSVKTTTEVVQQPNAVTGGAIEEKAAIPGITTKPLGTGVSSSTTPEKSDKSETIQIATPIQDTVEALTLADAEKALRKSKTVWCTDPTIISEYDAKYLPYTNYTALQRVADEKFFFYDSTTLAIMVEENARLEKLDQDAYIEQELEAILSGCKAKTALRQLKYIELYMIKHYNYDKDYKNGKRSAWSKYQDVNGANLYYLLKQNKGICADFVELYRRLCEKIGIECVVEYGGTTSKTVRCHAWNIVTVNGVKYYKDITWDIQRGYREWCDPKKVSPKYFIENHHMMCSY